jgi:hypothetical protein
MSVVSERRLGSNFDRYARLARLLLEEGVLPSEGVDLWLASLTAAGLDVSHPSCLTLVPSTKRAIKWDWRINESERFARWLVDVLSAYGFGGVACEFSDRSARFCIDGVEVTVDWLYVNRERWFGGVAAMLNRALEPRGLAMEVFDTGWVDVVVVVAHRSTVAALSQWFMVEE